MCDLAWCSPAKGVVGGYMPMLASLNSGGSSIVPHLTEVIEQHAYLW